MSRSRVTGGKEIARALREVSAAIDVPLNEASRFALQPTLAAAKANLRANGSVESGELLSLMTVKKDKQRSRKLKPVHVVGPSTRSPGYRKAHLVEFGTAPHAQPKHGHDHPGARPHPFLTPAYESTKAAAVTRFGERIGPAIERRAAKRAAKAEKKVTEE